MVVGCLRLDLGVVQVVRLGLVLLVEVRLGAGPDGVREDVVLLRLLAGHQRSLLAAVELCPASEFFFVSFDHLVDAVVELGDVDAELVGGREGVVAVVRVVQVDGPLHLFGDDVLRHEPITITYPSAT